MALGEVGANGICRILKNFTENGIWQKWNLSKTELGEDGIRRKRNSAKTKFGENGIRKQ